MNLSLAPQPQPPSGRAAAPAAGALNRQHTFATVLALALYAGLAAISVIWLSDWGRHGPAFAARFGGEQITSLGMAAGAGALLWLTRDAMMLCVLRVLALWQAQPVRRRVSLAAMALLGFVALIAALHWGHKLHLLPGLPEALRGAAHRLSKAAVGSGWFPFRPSLSVELLRLPACVLLAWCLYRWQHAGLSLRSNLALAAAVVAALGLGLWLSEDKGPMLVIAIAAVGLASGVLVQLGLRTGRPVLAWGFGLGAGALGLTVLMALLPLVTPRDRLEAWDQPFDSKLDYLAQITWFLQHAGWTGSGAGNTAWCGHMGSLVGRCLGMPTETQSDYTLAALAGLWGPFAAWALVAACALWLLVLMRLAANAPRPHHGIDAASLAASAGALYALLLLAQLFVTCLGNVGVLPLTGVTLPLLSWGRASLLSATLAMALVLPRAQGRGIDLGLGRGALGSLWRSVGAIAALGSVFGLALLAGGLLQRYVQPAPAQLPSGRANPWLPVIACVRTADGMAHRGLPLPKGWHEALCQAGVAPVAGLPGATAAAPAIGSATASAAASVTAKTTASATAPATVSIQPNLPDDDALRQALLRIAQRQPLATPIDKDGLRIPRRQDLRTSLDAALQSRSDRLASCFTGASVVAAISARAASASASGASSAGASSASSAGTAAASDACRGLIPDALKARYAQRHEAAAVRSISTITLRQSDSSIAATAHARSACSQAQMANAPRPAHCPPEAARAIARPGRQAQQALRGDDMVASVIKALLADALLSAAGGQRWLSGAPREQMLRALAASDTGFFIDHLLCFEPGADPARCTRPSVLARRAQELKLAQPIDLLGAAVQTLATGAKPAEASSLLVPGLPFDLPAWPPTGARADIELAAAWRCHAKPAKERWRGCEGEQLAALVAPLWGQGGARSNPLAVASLYQRIVASARGEAQTQQPHVLATPGQPIAAGFAPGHAELILEGLRRTPLVGTAKSACTSVRGPAGCAGLDLAMKTGTSLFPQHAMTVDQRADRCQRVFALENELRQRQRTLPAAQAKEALYCALYPMKWAVLIEPARPGVEALLTVVLVERNSRQSDGHLDAGDDRSPNVAAEAALLLHAHRWAPPGAITPTQPGPNARPLPRGRTAG